jgi:bifunctional polynucleotide phosphatase/kinase
LKNIRRIPDVGYNMFKKKYEEPTMDEGFTEIKEIEFALDFEKDEHKKLFLQRA